MVTEPRPAGRPPRHAEQDWQPRPTLAGRDYTGLEVYEAERERIWYRGWVCVGRAEEVPGPGDYLVRDLAGESIFVVRNRDGEIRAFYNVCAHRGTRLLDDAPDCGHAGKAIKCPYHAWTYDLDGRLVASPNVHEDERFERADHPLARIAVDTYAGFLFVSLDEAPTSLEADLRDSDETITDFDRYRMAELRVARRLTYDVAANWKIVVENYNECLHCPTIHPELVQMIPIYRKGEVWDGETRDGGNEMRPGATSFTITGTSGLEPFPGLLPEDRGMYYGVFQFPNFMVNLHPDAVMTYTLYPVGPDRTTVVSEFLFRPETIARPDFDPSGVVDLWDLISRQDWQVCERAQRGVASRSYRAGVYPRKDRLLFDFNERWRHEMGRPLIG